MGKCLSSATLQSTQYESVSNRAVSNTPVTNHNNSILPSKDKHIYQGIITSSNNNISISPIQTNNISQNNSIKIQKPLPKIENGEEFVKFLMTQFCPNPTVSSNISLDNYYKKLNSHFSKALNYVKVGNDIKSYIELMRFCQLYTTLSKHNNFLLKQYEKFRNLNKKRCNNALSKLEELKPKLMQRYDEIKQNKIQENINKNKSNTNIYKETAGEILEYIHQMPSAPIIQTDESNNILLEQHPSKTPLIMESKQSNKYPTPKHSEKHQVVDNKIIEYIKQKPEHKIEKNKSDKNHNINAIVNSKQYPEMHENIEQHMHPSKELNNNYNISYEYPTPKNIKQDEIIGPKHEIEKKKCDDNSHHYPTPKSVEINRKSHQIFGSAMLNIEASVNTLIKYKKMTNKATNTAAYLIFKINKTLIDVEKEVMDIDLDMNNKYFTQFCHDIYECKEPRYGVVFSNDKIIFIYWSPDTSIAKNKMIYAAVQSSFYQQLTRIKYINIFIQATDRNELETNIKNIKHDYPTPKDNVKVNVEKEEKRIKKNIDENDENECIVCMDLQRSYAFVPCGHLCLCEQCKDLFDSDKCPICQEKSNAIIKIYK